MSVRGFCFDHTRPLEKVSRMDLTLAEDGNPSNRIELSDEQIKQFRQTILAEYQRQQGDGARKHRTTIKTQVYVEVF